MLTFWRDARYGVRTLLRKPGFALVAVLTLALGIGANTAIFSVVNAVLLRPLPYHKADQLEMFYFTNVQGEEEWFISPAAYQDLRDRNSVFAGVAAWGNNILPANLSGDGEPERLPRLHVSANFFQVLGVAAERGRAFLTEDRFDQHRVVISYDLWQRRFGGDSGVIGRPVVLNGTTHEIIGVMPADFRFLLKTDVWTALDLTAAESDGRDRVADLHPVARRKPGVSSEQARAEIENILRPHSSRPNSTARVTLKSLQAVLTVGEREMLLILFAAVGFVLLIACINVASLLLARAAGRRRELAIRGALGAGRWHILRQLTAESAVLAFCGGACGLLLAGWCVDLLISGLPESVAAKNSHVAMLELDGLALGYTLALCLATTFISGLLPALRASKVNLDEALKEGGRSETQGRGLNRFHSLLLVAQLALAMVLLVGAGLMIKSFWRLSNTDRGFATAGVLTAKIDPAGTRYRDPQQTIAFYRQVIERVSTIPGVRHAGIINSWDYGWKVMVTGRPPVPEEHQQFAARYPVSTDYFQALNIPLRAGRLFTERDTQGAPPVAIIDETLARRHFPDENPIGKYLEFHDASREIIGVVGATMAWRPYSFSGNEMFPRVYLPYQQFACDQQENCWSMSLIVRTESTNPASVIPAIRREIMAVDKDQPVHSFKPLDQSVAELGADQRFSTTLLAAFAALAVLLATVGIYGVTSYAVAQRTHEIGVRLALGAKTGDVSRLVVGPGMLLVGIGIAIGFMGSLAVTHLLASLLYGVTATDPLTMIAVAALLAVVALTACLIPARRATRIDPLVALRHE